MKTKKTQRKQSKAATEKTPEPLLPAILSGISQGKPSNDLIDKLFVSVDRVGLFNVFLGEVGNLVEYRLLTRNLRARASDLKPELVAEAICELWAATGRILGREMNAEHVRNSLRLAIEARLDKYLDQLPIAGARFATLKKRREREKNGGDISRPAADRRPADMPEVASDHIPWNGYYSFEWHTCLFDAQHIGMHQNDVKRLARAVTDDTWWYSFEYKLFVERVRNLALKLAVGNVQLAVRFILEGDWNDSKHKWRLRKVAAVARHVGMSRKKLAAALDSLAHQIAASLPQFQLEFAKVYLAKSWPKILEYELENDAESVGLTIETSRGLSSTAKSNMVVEMQDRPGFKGNEASERLNVAIIDAAGAHLAQAEDAAAVQARLERNAGYVIYEEECESKSTSLHLAGTPEMTTTQPTVVIPIPHFPLGTVACAIPA